MLYSDTHAKNMLNNFSRKSNVISVQQIQPLVDQFMIAIGCHCWSILCVFTFLPLLKVRVFVPTICTVSIWIQ